MHAFTKLTALAAAGLAFAAAVPASAAVEAARPGSAFEAPGMQTYHHSRHHTSREEYRRGYGDRDYRGHRDYRRSDYRRYDRPTRAWRGSNGRYYCRKENGTTGLLVGGVAGALIGRGLDGGRDRTVGTLLGAAGGALLGRAIDRSDSRCR